MHQITFFTSRTPFSGFAWGFGYLGGVACFVGVYFLNGKFGLTSRWPYLFTAGFYLLFGLLAALFLARFVPNRGYRTRVSWSEMLLTLDSGRRYLLLGYWLISDAITAVIAFTAVFGSTQLHLSVEQIGALLLLVQILAFPGTYLVSRMASVLGTSRVLAGCVVIWIIILATLISSKHFPAMVVVAILTSLVIGSTQALMRAQYSYYVQTDRASEIFGWYALSTESSAIMSPLLFGIVASTFGGERLAMAVLVLPLLLGMISVWRGAALLNPKFALGSS